MSRPGFMFAAAVIGWAVLLGIASATPAAAQSPSCATTSDAGAPSTPVPGSPCWTDVEPYPFGADGDPVDTSRRDCATFPQLNPRPPGDPAYAGYDLRCYLQATSFAFRSWDRGLAAMRNASGVPGNTPFGVWQFNGARWFPDPTFPGSAVCGGDTVLWAGKLDYWLVGAPAWGSLCRFDGTTFTWQPMSVPTETLAKLRPNEQPNAGKPVPGIKTGTCFAWDDCWFLGSFGTVVRWNGSVLSDASPDLSSEPWLRTHFTAAVGRSDPAGARFVVAVGTTGGPTRDELVPPRPGPAAPPQMFALGAAAFAPIELHLPTVPQPFDPYRTDLVAADLTPQRRGWVAAMPTPWRFSRQQSSADQRFARPATVEPAPLIAVTPTGRDPACAGPPADRFTHIAGTPTRRSYLWSSVATIPGSTDVLAGGEMRPGVVGTARNDDGSTEPLLVRAGCDGAVAETRFRERDPTLPPAGAPLVPANRTGSVISVASTAPNDAWASTAGALGGMHLRGGQLGSVPQRPHLYRLRDGAASQALPGDDDEERPIELALDPPVFEDVPQPDEPPATDTPPQIIDTPQPAAPQPRARGSIYALRSLKPRRIATGRDRGRLLLVIKFKVRPPVTIGLRGYRGRRIVSRSGLKSFKGTSGSLALKLDRRRWPTRLNFYYGSAGSAAAAAFDQAVPEPPR